MNVPNVIDGAMRFLRILEELERGLEDFLEQENPFDRYYKDLRVIAFRLEVLGKVYRKLDPRFEEIRIQAKLLEDALGAYDLEKELLEFLAEANSELGAEFQHRDYLVDAVGNGQLMQMGFISDHIENDWLKKDRVGQIRSQIIDFSFFENNKDREFFGNRLAKRLLKLQERIDQDYYPHEEIEVGTHKLRREIRYIAMMIQFADGLFTLESESSFHRKIEKEFSHYPLDEIRKSRFVQLPKPAVNKEIPLAQSPYLVTTHYIDLLGKAKDWGGWIDQIAAVFDRSENLSLNLTPEHYAHDIVSRVSGFEEASETHKELQKEITDSQIFSRWATDIQKEIIS